MVFLGEVIHDAAEILLEIEGVERDIETIGDAAGVGSIDGAAAAFLVCRARALGSVDAGAHEQADDLVTFLLQKVRGHGTVHATAHGQNDTPGHQSLPTFYLAAELAPRELIWRAHDVVAALFARSKLRG